MRRYIGLIDGEEGGYGIVFPDLPGCTAMGATIEEAITNGADAMRLWIEVIEEKEAERPGGGIAPATSLEVLRRDREVAAALEGGSLAVSVPLVRVTGRSTKANLSIDDGILAAIDAEAERRKLTRSGFIEAMVREMLPRTTR